MRPGQSHAAEGVTMVARRRLMSWGSVLVFGATLLLALAQQQSRPAQAQDPGGDDEEEPDPGAPAFEPPAVGPAGNQRFSLAARDEGAVPLESLSAPERE